MKRRLTGLALCLCFLLSYAPAAETSSEEAPVSRGEVLQ